ncbi:MAG: PAS domain S-box protein [Dehalococcoidia bacterium]|nr:MAG: PAS domain S-box protein [Dehalococcoidia bacterium]
MVALARWTSQCKKILSSYHFWLTAAMLAAATILHYVEQIGILTTAPPSVHFGFTRHAMDRILFLLPIVYAGFIFGVRGGLVTLGFAALAMLPRVIFISASPQDALFEMGAVILVGSVVILWFRAQRKETEQRQQALLKLEAARQELQSHLQTIRSNERRLAALNTISSLVTQSLQLEQILNSAIDKVMEMMEVEAALIFLLDEEAREIVLNVHRGVSTEFARGVSRMRVGEGFNGQVAESGQPMVVEDACKDPKLSRVAVREENLHAELIVPLISKGKIMGTLCVAMHSPRQFLLDEVDLLFAIGNQIGIAIENTHLFQQLQASEQSYRDLFENANDAIWVQDLEGNILVTNKACEKLTGYTQEELTGAKVVGFLSEEGLNIAREVRHKLLKGEVIEQPYEQRLIKKDGTEAIMKLATSLITTDGQPTGFQHIARDVTEEKRMQENLRFYVQQVIAAQEEERKRIARELHDEPAQSLLLLSQRLDALASASHRKSFKPIQEQLEGLRTLAVHTLEGLRRYTQDLRPSILDDLGLVAALEWLADELSKNGISARVEILGVERALLSQAQLLLFRIAQEALSNVRRHSQASIAEVTIEFDEGKTRMTIKDNGKGFELPRSIGDFASTGKLGLMGMQERVRLLRGTLTLHSELGEGTIVMVEVPV